MDPGRVFVGSVSEPPLLLHAHDAESELQDGMACGFGGANQIVIERGKWELAAHGKFEVGRVIGSQSVGYSQLVYVCQNIVGAVRVNTDIQWQQRIVTELSRTKTVNRDPH